MMRNTISLTAVICALGCLGMGCTSQDQNDSIAIQQNLGKADSSGPLFGESEIDNETLAVSICRGYWCNLSIYEASRKDCWDESDSGEISFPDDMVGCKGAGSSSGYVLRVDGEDLGLDYLLTVRREGGQAQLLGVPRFGIEGEEFEIAETNEFDEDDFPNFTKLNFYDGWGITKRTYHGQQTNIYYVSYSDGSSYDNDDADNDDEVECDDEGCEDEGYEEEDSRDYEQD